MRIIENQLQNKKVLVTGATGFIGGRLAQRLAAEEGAIVPGTGRNLTAVPFLKDARVTLQKADLRDEPAMATAVAINKLFKLHVPINRERLKRYKLYADYPATKAETMLGYQIRVPIDEGMARTEIWLRQEGYLPPVA
jgi:nucleoside-diphosphate-sugar epimerase